MIAAVNGAALGAGFVLAACCDLIFAADSAVFGMPEIDVGLGGGASFLQRILPPSKVRRMMLTGERVPAAELHRLGAVEACLPDAQLLPAALGDGSDDRRQEPRRGAHDPRVVPDGRSARACAKDFARAELHDRAQQDARCRGSAPRLPGKAQAGF